MGTLRSLKTKMKSDQTWCRQILRSTKNEILIDLDGDKEADIAFLDITGSGDIDFLALDLTGDGEFDIYIGDTDEKGIPEIILYKESADGDLKTIRPENLIEHDLIAAASLVRSAVITGDYISDTFEEKLDELDKQIKRVQKEVKSKRSANIV